MFNQEPAEPGTKGPQHLDVTRYSLKEMRAIPAFDSGARLEINWFMIPLFTATLAFENILPTVLSLLSHLEPWPPPAGSTLFLSL